MALHGSVVELHVVGLDQQELGQQGLSKSVGRDRGLSCWLWAIMLSLECMMNWEPSGISTPAVGWVSASSSWRSQEAPCVGAVTSSTLLTWLRAGNGMCRGARVTCGRFMAEMDAHVLRIVDGIWVGKIVFLIFRICVNNSTYKNNSF